MFQRRGRQGEVQGGRPGSDEESAGRVYTRCQVYTRGAVGTVTELVYESPAAEDEAWDNTDKPEWFYSVVFRQKELWPEYPDLYAEDTRRERVFGRWLEPA